MSALIDDAECLDAPEAMALAAGAARMLLDARRDAQRKEALRVATIRADSEHWRLTARFLARAARKSQAMPSNPIVLEPLGSMRTRAERARRQWVAALVAMMRWVNGEPVRRDA